MVETMAANKVIRNMLGKKKRGKDSDMDGVIDSKDCQPRNTMRQDAMGFKRLTRMQDNMARSAGSTPQLRRTTPGISEAMRVGVEEYRQRTTDKQKRDNKKVDKYRFETISFIDKI